MGVDFTAMSSNTFGNDNAGSVGIFRGGLGGSNAYPKMGPLIINEVMYHPPDIISGTNLFDDSTNEYIEIYNIMPATTYLYDTNGFYSDNTIGTYADGRTNTWKIGGQVDFVFPTNVHLAAGQSLLLVNFDPITNVLQLNAFRTKYGVPVSVPIFGPYLGGKLKNSGGSIDLYKPDPPQPPDHPDFRFVPYILVDRVSYTDHSPWPTEADGAGKALQRLVPEHYANDPVNWVAADPTPGWQTLHIDSARPVASSFVLGFNGLMGSTYSVQYRPNLKLTNWLRLTNLNALGASGLQQVTNSLTPSNRLYRLVTPSQ